MKMDFLWRRKKKNTIFVAIASYVDPELKHTILDCVNKAKYPDNLYFGICYQYNEDEKTNKNCIDDIIKRYNLNIKIVKYHHSESKGGCWARNLAQKLHGNQEYTLQVDSHTRFIENWDELILKDYAYLKNNKVKKPLISFLPPCYRRDDIFGIDHGFDNLNNLTLLNVPKFSQITKEYWPVYSGYDNIQDIKYECTNIKALYGGFIFSKIDWIKEIEQDPEHYYTGEEFALALRSYTYGYDIYTPSKILAWHRCHNIPLPKHFSINPETGIELHRKAIRRLQSLIEHKGDLGKYDLGSERTIEEYEKFAGVDFKNCTITN